MTATMTGEQFRQALLGMLGTPLDQSDLQSLATDARGDGLMLVDGKLVDAAGGATFDNVNPATGRVIGAAPDGGWSDLENAIGAARRAFDSTDWSTNHAFRRTCIEQLQAALDEASGALRATIVAELGAPVRTINLHVDNAISSLDYWAALATEYQYEQVLPASTEAMPSRRMIWREPVGVVAAITPWNMPLYITIGKLAPALAAGNTVIVKPAPQTPWNSTLLATLIAEHTDIPPGVVNVVTTSDNSVAELLTTDPRVDMIHFTGSTAIGRTIAANASATVKKVALELGGKSANIVLDDAPIPFVVPFGAAMVCMNAGQGCVLPTRMLVPRSRYDECVELAEFAFTNVPVGDPLDPDIIMGPVVSEVQRTRVLGYIEKAVSEGGRVVVGEGAVPKDGFYVPPTLIADVDPDSTIAQEEVFGPVLAIIPYQDDDEAVRIANNSIYGLSGYVWGPEAHALPIARRMRTGTLAVNGGSYYSPDTPVGGWRQSGTGREYGIAGFEELLEIKTVAIGPFGG